MNLASNLKTYKNALKFKSFVEDINLSLSKDKRWGIESLLEKSDNVIKDLLLDLLKKSDVDLNNSDVVLDSLSNLIEEIDGFEKIDITVSVEPNEKLIREIYNFIQNEIDKDFLIAFEVDKNLLGGVRISYKGKYLDLSLKSKLESVFENKEVEIK